MNEYMMKRTNFTCVEHVHCWTPYISPPSAHTISIIHDFLLNMYQNYEISHNSNGLWGVRLRNKYAIYISIWKWVVCMSLELSYLETHNLVGSFNPLLTYNNN